MGEPKTLVQGTLDMLVLKTLALEPMHRWGIVHGPWKFPQMRHRLRIAIRLRCPRAV